MVNNKVTTKEIEARVKEVIAKTLSVSPEKITLDAHLQNDLGLDSFAAIEMVYSAEDEFGISISDEELTKLSNVKDIVKIVEKKLKK